MHSVLTIYNSVVYIPFIGVIFLLLIIIAVILYFLRESIKHKRLSDRIIKARINPIFWVNREGAILHMQNPEKCKWIDRIDYGKTKIKVYVKDCLSPKYGGEWIKATQEVFNTKQRKQLFVQTSTAEGEPLHIHLNIVYYDRSTLIVFEQNLSDLERERLENKKQSYLMQALLENLPIPTSVKHVNNDRTYIIWNKAAENLISTPKDKMIGHNESVLREDIRQALYQTDQETIANGSSSTILNFQLPDEKTHAISMHKSLVTHEEDQWIISSAHDITELKEKTRQLELLNRQHELILKAIGMISWSLDSQSNHIQWYRESLSANALLPHMPSIITTEDFYNVVTPEHREKINESVLFLKNGAIDTLDIEYQVVNVYGQKIWIESFAIVSEREADGTPKCIVGASYNIEERKRMQHDLIASKDKAEESNHLKSAFLANMSHEIRTPLNAIVGFSNVLGEKCADEESEYYIQVIEHNNQHLLQLINDILDLSKIEAGVMKFAYDEVDINTCLKETESFARMRVGEQIEIIAEAPLENCILYTEHTRIIQIINNFVGNAIKHTESGSIRIGYNLPENGFIRFYVKDTGRGIPTEQKDSVFDRFVQLDSFKQGAGLGLAISRTIIEKLNGKIGVESALNQGSEFWFTIPYQPVEKKKSASENEELLPEEELLCTHKPTLLIAEDNESNFNLYRIVLGKDYTLFHAWNGKEAVDLCEEIQPDLILMDIKMPVMNGHEATAIIREKFEQTPIIAVTAHAFANEEEYTRSETFNAYLSKPINHKILRSTIIEQLNRNQASV